MYDIHRSYYIKFLNVYILKYTYNKEIYTSERLLR